MGPPCPRADRMVGASTRVPARGIRRKEHVVGGSGWWGRRGLGRGGGRSAAGMAITWLVVVRMGMMCCCWAWARAVDSVSCLSSMSSMSGRVVLGCTLRRSRNGLGERKSGAGRSGWGLSSGGVGMGVGVPVGMLGIQSVSVGVYLGTPGHRGLVPCEQDP